MKVETENIWTTAFGNKINFSEIDHQHLSNILWFNEVFNNHNRYNNEAHFLLGLELEKRFKGERLKWVPLPVPNELRAMKEMRLLNNKGEIKFKGETIGSVRHIAGWEKYI